MFGQVIARCIGAIRQTTERGKNFEGFGLERRSLYMEVAFVLLFCIVRMSARYDGKV